MKTAERVFCPGYPRTAEGYIQFPNDVPRRRELFSELSFQHPAKANIWMIEALVDWVSKPGETILDPFGGTGTIMVATLRPDGPRRVVLLEDAPIFYSMEMDSREKFIGRGVDGNLIMCLLGDNREYLPMKVDHAIFSPPYASVLKSSPKADSSKALAGSSYVHKEGLGEDVFKDYLGTEKNFGRLNPFFYNQQMAKLYELLLQSVRIGGTMTVIVQDLMRGGERNELSQWVLRTCVRSGWQLEDWFERYSPGTGFKKLHKSKGREVVENESCIVFRRPG